MTKLIYERLRENRIWNSVRANLYDFRARRIRGCSRQRKKKKQQRSCQIIRISVSRHWGEDQQGIRVKKLAIRSAAGKFGWISGRGLSGAKLNSLSRVSSNERVPRRSRWVTHKRITFRTYAGPVSLRERAREREQVFATTLLKSCAPGCYCYLKPSHRAAPYLRPHFSVALEIYRSSPNRD